MAWQGCSETWPKKTIVGSGEEQRGAESGIGDMVALGVWEAFDHAVETQTAGIARVDPPDRCTIMGLHPMRASSSA